VVKKTVKIGPVDSEIICLPEIVKKIKKINARKIYNPPGRHARWAN